MDVGRKIFQRCKEKKLTDRRAGASGRKPHQNLRDKVDRFWTDDIETEPSHYSSTKRKQKCVGVSSMTHGYLIFLAKYFPDKYAECKSKQFFPGVNMHRPASLSTSDVPVLACIDCVTHATAKNLQLVVCPHLPKFGFFKRATAKYNLTFKKPATDQCEQCNRLHSQIALLRAMGRDNEADAAEDTLESHRENQTKKKLYLLK